MTNRTQKEAAAEVAAVNVALAAKGGVSKRPVQSVWLVRESDALFTDALDAPGALEWVMTRGGAA